MCGLSVSLGASVGDLCGVVCCDRAGDGGGEISCPSHIFDISASLSISPWAPFVCSRSLACGESMVGVVRALGSRVFGVGGEHGSRLGSQSGGWLGLSWDYQGDTKWTLMISQY